MKKPKGSELKMPTFLADLYYDLRDRRLLPLVALVVVAIAAVPFLLGRGGEEVNLPAPGGGALSELGSATGKTSKLTVVEATPGLRDYRKRLSERTPVNPFKQRYTALPESARVQSSGSGSEATGNESGTVTVTESGTTETPGGGSPGGSGAGSGSGSGSGGGSGPPKLIQFVVDVQISHMEATANGGQTMSELEVRRQVRPLTQLPGKEKPVVTTMGINLHNGKVFFLVSNDVKSLDGDFTCVTRTPTGTCELLEIQPGMQLEAAYGSEKVLYRIKVTKIDVVSDGRAGDRRSSRADFVAPPPDALQTP